MSAWLFDLGNTRLKCAPLLEDGRIGEVIAVPHRIDQVGGGLADVLPGRIEQAWLASVAAPELTAAVLRELEGRCRHVSLARTRADCAGVRIAYAQPDRLGVDRFLALLAAHARGDGPSLLCGVGTALTVDLLDRDGCHLGGRIAPSPTLMREVLHARAAQLPVAGGGYREFAADTADALASGCEGAALGLIEHSVAAARQRLGTAPALLLHGGGGENLMPHLPTARWVPGLVIEGLAVWAKTECA
ncbi:type III pantothenate kinase [Lysobacter sp. D1-1-M9]|uniref:type III pantothenate kinase n=1 Tax=Novilysobacter longmucuonensis TaxID=3098603 RepID=UPI002FC9A578